MKQKALYIALIIGIFTQISCNKKSIEPSKTYPQLKEVEGKVVIAAYFDTEVCNEIVLAGSYNKWSTQVPNMLKFQAIDATAYPNWYKVEIDTIGSKVSYELEGATYTSLLQAKPVQLTNDGSFEWMYQIGDPTTVTVVEGDVVVQAGFSGESNLYFNSTKPVVLRFSSWKRGGSPCKAVTKKVTFTVTTPTLSSEYTVYAVGDFNEWSVGKTPLTKQADGSWRGETTTTIAGGFKYVLNGNWEYEELAATAEGATCASSIENRTLQTENLNRVQNFNGVTAVRCD